MLEAKEAKNETNEKFYGLGYDRMFKAIFCSEEVKENKDYHLLEKLINLCTHSNLKVKGILTPELPVRNAKERTKRLDLLVECTGAIVHIELNSEWDRETRLRNNAYFFSFYSGFIKSGSEFDKNIKFIHVSLNFNMNKDMVKMYDTNDLDSTFSNLFLENVRMIHVNLDYHRKKWYDDVAKGKYKASLLTLISLKKKEDILKCSKLVNDAKIKECVDKIMQLNGGFLKSFWGLTPEQENKMMQNSREKRIREESLAEGKAAGEAVGEVRGEKNSIIQIAKNMLKEKCDINLISKVTQLSKSEIKTLM